MQGGSLLSVCAVVVGERSLCLLYLILCEVGGHCYLRDGKCSACFEVACDAQPFFGSTFPFSCHQAAIPVSEVLQAFLVVLPLYGSIFDYFGLLKESVEDGFAQLGRTLIEVAQVLDGFREGFFLLHGERLYAFSTSSSVRLVAIAICEMVSAPLALRLRAMLSLSSLRPSALPFLSAVTRQLYQSLKFFRLSS